MRPPRRPLPTAAAAAAITVTVTAALWAFGASAEPATTPPAPSAPRPLTIVAPAESVLANGLRVVVARRPGVGLVTARLVVLAGSEADPPGRAGLADMTAGLLVKGTRRHSATALATAAEALGGSLDSGAGWNRSGVTITVAATQLDAALALVAEAMLQPSFAQAELDRLRAQTLDGLKVAYTQPGTIAALAAERLVFGNSVYGHPSGGTPASLTRLTRADLLALHASLYRPDNAVLVLSGDIDEATARRLATRHFGAWRKPPSALPAAPAEAGSGAGLAPRIAIIDMPNAGQADVTLVVPMPPRGPDRAVADVMNSVLGGGYSSRLNQEIRIKRGLSYGATSELDSRRQGGVLAASAQTKNESAAEVAALLQGEFDRLVATAVPEDELSARKATLIGGFSRSVETTAGLGAAVTSLVVAGLPTDELGQRIAKLSAVTGVDVQRYAAAHLGAEGRRVVVAGDAERFAGTLPAAAPGGTAIVLTVPVSRLDLEARDGLTAP